MGILKKLNKLCWNRRFGIKLEFIRTISRKLNFTWRLHWITNSTKLLNIYFEIFRPSNLMEDNEFHVTSTFIELRDIILTTPGELYTSYEKLLLPFDNATWILLHLTFLIAFISVFIINRLPNFIQNRFYGENVQTPALNIISTFFGLTQRKIPKEYFPRFLLILFIFFCLIFRTCYQSKMYEFITSAPRRTPPLSVQDLKDRNYNLYSTLNILRIYKTIEREINSW